MHTDGRALDEPVAGPLELRAQEPQIERRVVRREHSALQQPSELGRDVGEGGRVEDVGRADAVDVLRAEITLGVDQRLPAPGDRAVVVDVGHADLDDAVVIRRQDAGGLEVHDRERHHAPASSAMRSASRTRSLPDMSWGRSASRVAASVRFSPQRGSSADHDGSPRQARSSSIAVARQIYRQPSECHGMEGSPFAQRDDFRLQCNEQMPTTPGVDSERGDDDEPGSRSATTGGCRMFRPTRCIMHRDSSWTARQSLRQ